MRVTLTEDDIREILVEAIEKKIKCSNTSPNPNGCYFDFCDGNGEKRVAITSVEFVAEFD